MRCAGACCIFFLLFSKTYGLAETGYKCSFDRDGVRFLPPQTYFAVASYARTPVLSAPFTDKWWGIAMLPTRQVTTVGYRFHTDVEVTAPLADTSVEEGSTRTILPREVETSAGTFGDLSRFMQTLAGVVSDNDQRNDFLVRGGNPSENLVVIDNIDVPSINQIALSDTTGGFVSMLDAEAIQKITLHTDAYDDRFDQRLSSVLEVSTRPDGRVRRHATSEIGLGGMGGSVTRPLGWDGSLFVSGRQGVLQYVTSDIGMNGVPHYRNGFVRADGTIDARNRWWGMSLTGIDSLQIHPLFTDWEETNPYDIAYSGWRNTTGLNWQHLFNAKSVGVMSLAHAAQSQSVAERAQIQDGALVYNEDTGDHITTLKYDWTGQMGGRWTLSAGTRASIDQLHYAVAQPTGLQNPYSASPDELDATAMDRRFSTFSSAAYVQVSWRMAHEANLVVGEREAQWALGGRRAMTPKLLYSLPVAGKLVHVGYAEYAQMPSTLYLLSFDNLQKLPPIRNRQLTAGVTLADNRRARVMLEAYQKKYASYPVAANYPQLSMANIADTFGEAFLMFPMVGQGTGVARGVELTMQTNVSADLTLAGTITYAHSRYAGLDDVLRRGNFDLPIQMNLTGVWQMRHHLTLSWRYTATSGVPYTPDDMTLSYAQNRDVYDLTKINSVRSSAYQRLDFRLEQSRQIGLGTMTWHMGLQNAMNTRNFYANLWQHNIGGDSEQTQMPLFPDGGVKYAF